MAMMTLLYLDAGISLQFCPIGLVYQVVGMDVHKETMAASVAPSGGCEVGYVGEISVCISQVDRVDFIDVYQSCIGNTCQTPAGWKNARP
jgi:hypothetical protein